jgi:RNA polymerase sigma-70 factor (ECF subfamily)
MSYAGLDDKQLLELLGEEDQYAFAEIYNRYWKLLYTTANSIIRNESLAQDAVQEVFIALWQKEKGAEIQFLRAYLQQAVRFQVLKAIRNQKADEQFYSRLAAITSDIVYENPLLFKEQEGLLRQIFDSLPEDCKLVFKLSREENLTYRQIAAQLDISEKTVEKKMSICLRQIREALQQKPDLVIFLFLAYQLHN